MSLPVCTCPTPTPYPKRSARAGVVLHDTATGLPIILVQSTAPKVWEIMVGSAIGWRKARINADNFENYHDASFNAPTTILAKPDLTSDFEARISDMAKAVRAFEKADAQYYGSLAAASPAPPSAWPPGSVVPKPTPPPVVTIDEPAPKETTGYIPRAKKASVTAATFEIDAPNPDRYFYESEADTRMYNDFIAIKLAGYDTNCMVVGPSGFGKTEGVKRQGEKRGVPVHVVNCQVITTPEKWLGEKGADPTRGTYFDVAEHIKWVERTHEDCQGAEYCIILYDELTRLRPELGNMLFSLLDGQHGLDVPQMGRRVVMAKENVVFATANIGSAYAGTFQLDWALRERFDATMERKFPPFEEEKKVVLTAYPKVTVQQAESMLKVAEHTRTLWKNGEIEAPISTRLVLSWARWVAGGYSVKDAAEYSVIPRYAEDGGIDSDRAKLKQAIDGKVAA